MRGLEAWWGVAVMGILTACSAEVVSTPGGRGAAGRGAAGASAAGNASYTAQGGTGGSPAAAPGPAGSVPGAGVGSECAAISQRAENQRQPADIIFAVDNSGSMGEEIAFVRDQLNAFSQQIIASGVDVRIILISASFADGQDTDDDDDEDDDDDQSEDVQIRENGICVAAPLGSGQCPQDGPTPHYFHVSEKVESHDALALFTETFPRWQSQLRAGASKTFVVVTDDNAEEITAAQFQANVAALPGGLFDDFRFSGIYCFSECADSDGIGTVYEELVQATGGVKGDLCEQNFAPVFDALANAVVSASGLQCGWDIPAPPAGQSFDLQQVNVRVSTQGAAARDLFRVADESACTTNGGWYYDVATSPQQILVCPSTCTTLQNDLDASVSVLFGCETLYSPE